MSVREAEPELAHCARCKRLYIRMRWNVCESCRVMEEVDFSRIREELERTPELTADELAERANLPVACVLRMLDEGLLVSTGDDETCGRCGEPAISPRLRLCTWCLMDLNRRITHELKEAQMRKREQVMKGKAQGVLSLLRARRREY